MENYQRNGWKTPPDRNNETLEANGKSYTKTRPIYLPKRTEASLNYPYKKKIESHGSTFEEE